MTNIETFLDTQGVTGELLLHGSRVDIVDGVINPNHQGVVCATNMGRVALLKAILSNQGLIKPGLVYRMDSTPGGVFYAEVHGMHSETIGELGFVYVVPANGFYRIGDTAEFHSEVEVPITAKIVVSKKEFRHPIYDTDNDEWHLFR